MVKVIASSLRKGNVVEQDGNLHVILTAENVHPGKGNSVTNVNMRRISDGVKVVGRWRTVEMVERRTWTSAPTSSFITTPRGIIS